ncbi:unnamed protein product [Urochloa humidicola]
MEASLLPLDLLLEISARCDPATIARYGATCKLVRRHVTDPAFLRRVRAASSSSGRFLIGLLYHRIHSSTRDGEKSTRRQPLLAAPKSSSSAAAAIAARLSAELAGPPSDADAVASRGGLLLLRSGRRHPTSLRVCAPVAAGGRIRIHHVLPPGEIAGHLHVLMPEDDDEGVPAFFKVLVADRDLRTQTYSSRAGAWGPVVTGTTAARVPGHYRQVQPSQVLLGGVAHWLYRKGLTGRLYSVLALDIGTGRAAWIEVPQDCHRRRREAITGEAPRELLLASSAGGELALLVWERPLAASMWTMVPSSSAGSSGRSWARRVVIDRTAILRSVQPVCNPLACQRVEFLWFAEESATVVFHLNKAGTALLNLRTLEVRHIQRSGLEPFEFSPFCVYELDLASLLPSR